MNTEVKTKTDEIRHLLVEEALDLVDAFDALVFQASKKSEADNILTEIAKLLAGLQVPVSLGMGRDGVLGTAYEPWLALWDRHHIGGGWRTYEEVEQRLREKLGMPPLEPLQFFPADKLVTLEGGGGSGGSGAEEE